MKKLALFAPTLVLCAACSGSAVSLQPGQWETTVQFTNIEMPGAPEAMVGPMRAMLSQPQTSSACMTPEEAANPGNRIANPDGSLSCQFTENTFTGGTIKIHSTCQTPRGAMTMNMEGTYTATTMQAQINQEIRPPAGTPGPQSVRLTGSLSGRRTGDCTSAPAAAGNSTG